jgi:3-hydroxybutyryl-CoA dehydrogenase
MEIKTISVIGGGTMGNGIAHVFALKGFMVNLIEMSEELAEKALKTISSNLDRQIKKNIITEEDKSNTLSKIKKIVGVEKIPDNSDLIIEAIYENKDAKLNVLKIRTIKNPNYICQ